MKKLLISLALLALPSLASAQVFCEGRPFDGQNQLSISWNACWFGGSTATSFATYNCLATPVANVTATLHFQFKSNVAMTSAVAITGIVDVVQSPGNPLPAFYHFESTGCAGSGAVKGFGLTVFPQAGISGCDATNGFDQWCNDGSDLNDCGSAGSGYNPDSPVAGVGRFIVIAVRTNARPIDIGANYWAYQIAFNNRLRTACTGCSAPASIIWQSLGIESNAGETSICLTGPDSPKGPDRAGSNGGPINGPTPVQQTTWGQIKALYR